MKWINMFNCNIKASILQCGFLSEPCSIERGCRQGDPLAPYLFLLCAQMLYLIIDFSKEIKGINIDNQCFKIAQFANDTTLLDGTKDSLVAALNTLERF